MVQNKDKVFFPPMTLEIGDAALLFTQYISRTIATVTIGAVLALGLPASAQDGNQAIHSKENNSEQSSDRVSPANSALLC